MTIVAQAVRSMASPLHVRAALIALVLLVALGAAMFVMLRTFSAQAALESSQRMNLELADYIAAQQAPGLIGADGRADQARMKDIALNVMMINPFVEVYLLDRDGRVLAHALEGLQGPDPVGRRVEMAPVARLLKEKEWGSPRLPILGTDPRNGQRRNIFSVAMIDAEPPFFGYLYVILNGSKAQGVAASLSNSSALRAMAIGVMAASTLAVIVLWLAWIRLTRPLRALTDELSSFRGDSPADANRAATDEIGVLRTTMRAMQSRIALQFKLIEDGDRQRRELISNISHDLRTPLSSIQGYVETVLLRGDQFDVQTRASHLSTALRQTDLLGKRIADLFELSKLDAGRAEPNQEVFCLAELLQDVVQSYQLDAQRRDIRLDLATGSHRSARVLADIAMIERVLQNLIDNALRHTAGGGLVTLAVRSSGEQLEVSVSDTGLGISKEHLPHIFERYWQAIGPPRGTDLAVGPVSRCGPSNAHYGSGLGLAIVKRILDLHGSVVQVHSELLRGTRIEFLLPKVS